MFKVIQDERDRYFKLKRAKVLPLNYEKRKAMFDEDERINLEHTNIRLKAMGKDEVKSVKDLPDNFEYDDPILQATVNIASDYTKDLEKDGVSEVQTTPILLQKPNSN